MIVRRTVYVAQEHGEIDLPLDQILQGATLCIYPEVAAKGVLSIALRKGRLTIRATSWIGLIPINETIAIEVQPRVPIRNLEGILAAVDSFDHAVFPGLRLYEQSNHPTNSFIDMIAVRFLDLLEAVARGGLHFEYRQQLHTAPGVVGRILPLDTTKLQWKKGRPDIAASISWQRTVDTGPNRLLKLALARLTEVLGSIRNRSGNRPILRRVAQANLVLQRVQIDREQRFLSHPLLMLDTPGPEFRAGYSEAIHLARLVLAGGGFDLRATSGQVNLPPILLNMGDVFEKYFRHVLHAINGVPNDLLVIDGNTKHSSDFGLRNMYDGVEMSNPPKMTPDIVVRRPSDGRTVVVDVKYKPLSGLPDRSDVEQVLAYGLRYGVVHVALAYPSRSSGDNSVNFVGTVGDRHVWTLRFDLNAVNLADEKDRFCRAFEQRLLSEVIQLSH